jgi:NADPH-dependent ferric siderophore reductase
VDRKGRATSDPAGLLSGLSAFALPSGVGHAYLFGEFHVMRIIQSALFDRGLSEEQVSHKAFWRSGLSNADHGEPVKSDA